MYPMKHSALRVALVLAAFAAESLAAPVLAQDYPNRPVRIIIGFGPGSVADVVALKSLNRAFVAKGLLAMRRREGIGLTALMDALRLSGPP